MPLALNLYKIDRKVKWILKNQFKIALKNDTLLMTMIINYQIAIKQNRSL